MFAKNALLVLGSVLLAAISTEVLLGALGIELDASVYTGDRLRGWAYRPHAQGWTVKEGRAYVRMNSEGMHDREHAVEKPDGTLRIAVLGDSFSGAVEVAPDAPYWHVLEQKLGSCPAVAPRNVEVLNFGVGGYGTAQELLTLRDRVWKYRPDIVLLQVYFGNDLFNNQRALNDRYSGEVKVSPYFVYRGDELVLDSSFQSSETVDPARIRFLDWTNEILNRSRLLLMLYKARRDVVRPRGTPLGDASDLDPGPMERLVLSPPAIPEMVETWKVTEGLLSLMNQEVSANGAHLYVTTISHPVQVFPSAPARAALAKKLGVRDLFYPDDRVRDYGRAHGIDVITLAPDMAAYVDAHPGVFLHGFSNTIMGQGHWNETGHRVAGELLASKLCAALGTMAAER